MSTSRVILLQTSNRDSQSSDTSSAYSGSDTISSTHSTDPEELDLSGLIESVVDSDEDDLTENNQVSLYASIEPAVQIRAVRSYLTICAPVSELSCA